MNKIIVLLIILIFTLPVFAQEKGEGEPSIRFSGEAKSGLFWLQSQQEGMDSEAFVTLHNRDDAGGFDRIKKSATQGRFRLNIDYDNGKSFGMRARLNWEDEFNQMPKWTYAFGYGNFFDDQLAISVGKLGGSPWGTGGPEMWKELEVTSTSLGMRTEFKPKFIPGLNVGFVLNNPNSDMDQGWNSDVPLSLLNILRESVVGAAYSSDYFMVRAAYRFDDEYDSTQENKGKGLKGEEDELIYRVEEKMLNRIVPGLQMWALGHLFGVTAHTADDVAYYQNWLFVQYDPGMFTAQIRFGYDYVTNRSIFHIKPSFYYHLFDRMISVGSAFWYGQDFGSKVYEGSNYLYMEVEPKVQVNFTSSYVAFAFNFRQEYLHPWTDLKPGKEPILQTQWMNLRFCIYY